MIINKLLRVASAAAFVFLPPVFASDGLAGARAQASYDPFLPKCGRRTRVLIPIPFWSGSRAEIARLTAAPGPPDGKIVYLSYAAQAGDVAVEESDVAYSLMLDTAPNTTKARPLKVIFWGKPQFANGYYYFSGFYALATKPTSEMEVLFHQLDTFDIVSSRRFCIAHAGVIPRAAPPASPPPQRAEAPALPRCSAVQGRRIPIPTWKPRLTAKSYFAHLPPMGDGRIVYIAIDTPEKCPDDPDHLFTVSRPDDVNDVVGAGGLEVNLRGSFSPYRDGCRLQGFYINQPVFGMHYGWGETYFAAIDKSRIEATGQYCLAGQAAR